MLDGFAAQQPSHCQQQVNYLTREAKVNAGWIIAHASSGEVKQLQGTTVTSKPDTLSTAIRLFKRKTVATNPWQATLNRRETQPNRAVTYG